MAENSKIEWTHHTANLWWGCTEVHSGCDNCYARVFSHRYDGGNSLWGEGSKRRAIKSVWNDLVKYQRLAAKAGEVHRVFVGSMMDIFEKSVELQAPLYKHKNTESLRKEFFTHVKYYPNLLFLLLTKRPSNINKMIPPGWIDEPPPNVMFGTSIVDQKTTETLLGQLAKVKGRKFVSVEPQLAEVSLSYWLDHGTINWVIQGGESGAHKRPFNVNWARRLRDQCKLRGVPYFFKQIDKIQPIPEDLMIRQFPNPLTR